MACPVLPPLRRLIQHVEGLESGRVLLLNGVEFGFQQDVIFREVAEDEGHLSVVGGILKDGARELVHRGDARAAGDECDVRVFVGLPGVFGDGPFEGEGFAGGESVEVFGHGAVRVDFYEEVEVAGFGFVGYGSVGADDGLFGVGGLEFRDDRG